jgi:hypothetical protein
MKYILPTMIGIFGLFYLLIKYSEWKTAKDEKKKGYRIELVGPGMIRAGENEYAMIYHQEGMQVTFIGVQNNESHPLDIGTAQGNEDEMAFYDTNKDLVLKRLKDEIKTKWKRSKITIINA